MKEEIVYNGERYEVSFYYQPEEAQTFEYAGCGESAAIEKVIHIETGDDITKAVELLGLEDEFEDLILTRDR
jgi:hypothetical protein